MGAGLHPPASTGWLCDMAESAGTRYMVVGGVR